MEKAADIVLLNGLLPLFAKDNLENIMQILRLFIGLKPANSALKHDEAQFKDVKRSFSLKVRRLTDGALHKVFLGHVHLEYTG